MRRLVLVLVGSMLAVSGVLRAEDDKESLDKLRELRSAVINKMPSMNDIYDNEHNGANAAANSLIAQYQSALATITKRIETESNKPADQQDKGLIDVLTAKSTRFQTLWNERTQNYTPGWYKKFGELSAARMNLSNLVLDLSGQDQVWLRAGCDRALLISVFTELNKRADEIKNQGTSAVTDFIKNCGDLERQFKD